MDKDFITIENVNYVKEEKLIEVENCIDDAKDIIYDILREIRWVKDFYTGDDQENEYERFKRLEEKLEKVIYTLER